MDAKRVIELLGLEPHPEEGGWFRETYRSGDRFEPGGAWTGVRSVGTAIYYLLTPGTVSALHRLPGDEIFHFYLGDPVRMLMLYPDGRSELVLLGPELEGMRLQHVVPGNVWQGSMLVPGGKWALLGTTMAPGFDYRDYEHGTRALLNAFPARHDLIRGLLPERGASPRP
ncbi:MAG: cupin domain-containing protein [Gemmatimonadota bacterium]|jgi:predicted cupin superfamily sugar epimerase